MAMDLISESGDEFTWSYSDWHWVLALAQAYGWEPAGAVPLDAQVDAVRGRRVAYMTNDGQKVQAQDAAALAAALERMLQDSAREETMKRLAQEVTAEVGAKDAPLQPWILDEDTLGSVEDFIEFCLGGAFTIE